jgi:hypothetical protein
MTRQLSATVLDASGARVPDASITFASDDEALASVTPDGLVSYVGVGSTNVSATSDDLVSLVP